MSFRSRLIGAWELVSWTGTSKDNPTDIVYPMGEDCRGMIVYTPDGYMSVQLNRPGTPLYSKGAFQGTDEERARAATDTFAYGGMYSLQEAEGDGPHRLQHHLKYSLPRNWIDTVQGRPARILQEDGETILFLEGEAFPDSKGTMRLPQVKFRRMKDNSQGQMIA